MVTKMQSSVVHIIQYYKHPILPAYYTKFCVAKRADFQTRKSNLIGDFMCKSRFNLNLGNVRSTLSRTKIA